MRFAAPLAFLLGLVASDRIGLVATAEAAQGSTQAASVVSLTVGTHERLVLERDVSRVAVGNNAVLSVEILSSRELLLLGLAAGRSSLLVWREGADPEALVVSVEPDLSLLRQALLEIAPAIEVEMAPDRPAVVLRGIVPDLTASLAAEAAALSYLRASGGGSETLPLVADGAEAEGGGEEVRVRPDATLRGDAAVINLLRLERLPERVDTRISAALEPLTGASVSVRRVLAGELPDDARDLFVLEGTVPDQVTLSRALYLASRALLGDGGGGATGTDIRVLADEAGGLTQVRQTTGGGSGSGQGGNQGNNSLIGGVGGAGGGGGGGQGGGLQLANRIGVNVGRAKLIEAADGRLLSMIEVESLPLVRVDVRIYEVDLSRLREWQTELGVVWGDFTQGALQPSGLANLLQGPNAAAIGPDDLQTVLGFLGGSLGGQTQLVSGGLAVDQVFRLLSNQEIARTLSRPSLTVLSGEQALFQVGGEIPVPVAVTVGGGTDQVLSGVEFKQYGVQLSVRPLVEEASGEVLTLDVAPVVSLPDLALTAALGLATGTSAQTTAFEQRATRTHTRLRDGDAMVLGGLVTARDQLALNEVPGLAELPGVGWLFKDESAVQQESELVIVVHPVIVRPDLPEARQWRFTDLGAVLQDCLEAVAPREEEPEPESLEKNDGAGTTQATTALIP